MAYTPRLKDLPDENLYQPSYEDIIETDTNKPAHELLLGQIPNSSHERSFFDEIIAPEAQEGLRTVGGTTAAFAVPELKIPGVSKAITSGIEKLSPIPKMLANYLRNIGKMGTGGAAAAPFFGQSPKEGAQTGVLSSALLQPLGAILPGANPIARGLIGATLGGAAAYPIGEKTGHPYLSEAAGIGLGGLAGLGKGAIPKFATSNVLGKANPEEVLRREALAKEIGVPITMTEAIGTPIAGKQMASLYTEPVSAQKLYEFGEKRKPLEEKSIKKLMDTISPKDAYINIEKPLYERSMNVEVPMNKFSEIIKDPYMKKQLDKVISDPLYAEELKSAQPNSLKVLDLLKRNLDSEIEGATKSESRLINSKLSHLKNVMDEISPEYRLARQVSEKRITRENIEKKMSDAEISGSNFYDKFLKNNDKYKKLYFSLRNPENPNVQSVAQKKLAAMKETFPLLIEPMNAKIAATLAESKIPHISGMKDQVTDALSNLLMKRYKQGMTELITSDQFDKQFNKLNKIRNDEKRAKLFANLLAKIDTVGHLKYERE